MERSSPGSIDEEVLRMIKEPFDASSVRVFTYDDAKQDYASLEKERRELENRLKAVKAQMADLQDIILEGMMERGETRYTMQGLTFSPRHEFFVSKAEGFDSEKVCEVLKEQGFGDFVKEGYSTAGLKGWISSRKKELEAEGVKVNSLADLLPDGVKTVLKISEVTKVGVRAAK
jgi:hypothetical protein